MNTISRFARSRKGRQLAQQAMSYARSPEGKAHLVVAIGCTGGRHRSVVIAEDLGAHFRDDGRFFVEVQHRDVDRAPARTE